MKFIVDRKTWFRGQGRAGSSLLNLDGKRCCIGFVGQQCGMPDESLLMRRAVFTVPIDWRKFPKWMESVGQCDIYSAYQVNDAKTITDEVREASLKEIFLRNGDEIEFVN